MKSCNNNQFCSLLFGESFSFLGTQVYFVSVAFIISSLFKTMSLAEVILYNNVFFLLGLFFLFIFNGVKKRTILICSNITRGVAVIVVFFILFRESEDFLLLFVSATFGLGRAADLVSRSTYTKSVFSEKKLFKFNYYQTIFNNLSVLLGPLAGNYIAYQFDPKFGFLFNGITFIIVGGVYIFLPNIREEVVKSSYGSDLISSFNCFKGNYHILKFIILDVIASALIFGIYRSLVPRELFFLFGDYKLIGIVFSFFGLGNLLGGVISKYLFCFIKQARIFHYQKNFFQLSFLTLLSIFNLYLLSLSTQISIYLIVTFIFGFLMEIYSFYIFNFFQVTLNADTLGKVLSIKYFLGTSISIVVLYYIDIFLTEKSLSIIDLKFIIFFGTGLSFLILMTYSFCSFRISKKNDNVLRGQTR